MGAEGEDVAAQPHPAPAHADLPRGGVEEGQQQPRIALHGAGHIHQQQQRQRLAPALAPRQGQQLAAAAPGRVQAARPVHARAATAGVHAARGYGGQRQGEVAHQALDQLVFAGAELVEVGRFQAGQGAGAHGGVQVHGLRGRGRGRCPGRGQRLAYARALGRRRGAAIGARQHLGQQLVRQLRVAEEGVEQLAEHAAVLLAADQHRLQRRADVFAPRQAGQGQGLLRQRHAGGVHGHTGTAQRAAEGAQVGRQLAAPGVAQLGHVMA